MAKLLSLTVMLLAALPAFAQEPATGDEAASAAKAAKTEPAEREFKPPPGFKTKKRGELVMYCQKDSTVGTRFKTEKCYDEAQLREYLMALEIQKRDIDRIRATCATGSTCSSQ